MCNPRRRRFRCLGDTGFARRLGGRGSQAYRAAHDHANEAESALAAVSIWQQFVDKYPDSPDIDTAKQELDRWKKLATEEAEKINGLWIGGDDRRKIIAQAEDLTRQAVDMLDKGQTLQAVDKLKESGQDLSQFVSDEFFAGICVDA